MNEPTMNEERSAFNSLEVEVDDRDLFDSEATRHG